MTEPVLEEPVTQVWMRDCSDYVLLFFSLGTVPSLRSSGWPQTLILPVNELQVCISIPGYEHI